MKLLTFTALLAVVMALFGCSSNPNANLPSQSDEPSAVLASPVYPEKVSFENRRDVRLDNLISVDAIQSISSFCNKTTSEILKSSEGNTIVSPTSLFFALSIAADGARGETREELLHALGFDTAEELRENAGKSYRTLYTDDEYSKVKVANSVWLDDALRVNEESDFFRNVPESFYGSLYSVDFQDSKTGGLISKWISDNTSGQLSPDIVTDPEQIISIINTIHFKSEWSDKFNSENNTEDIFHGTDGEKTVTFMNTEYGSHSFSRGDGYISSSLSTKSGANVVFVLPDEGVDVRSLIDTPEKVEKMFAYDRETICGNVTFKIPKLETKSDLSLNDVVKSLGVASAFSNKADFTGITDDLAFISDIHQQSKISMNEEGIEASSFTEIVYCGAALPTEKADLILDRPFIYGITYGDCGLLFAGIYENAE